MDKEINVKLSNGEIIPLNSEDPKEFFSAFVDRYLKPYYLKKNDWHSTLNESVSELDRICIQYRLARNDMIQEFLKTVEGRLARDISDLTGVDKIEILFENIDDYVKDISKTVREGKSQEEMRLKVSSIVEHLNLFELSELLIHFAKNMKC
jgi:hypothetical protein